MKGPLKGIRILDMGRVVASGYCGTLLGDMGAEVIKIERPGGEFDRKLGPFAPNGRAIVYDLIYQRNKKSITLNYVTSEGKSILNELIKTADVIISGFTRKGNQYMGLEYDEIKKINPGIIMVAISGYGQTGPYADRPAFDLIAQAESGAMSYTGFPENPPTRSSVPFADFGTATFGAYGAMLALFEKTKTGIGQMVDVSLFDTAVTFVAGMGVVAEYSLLNQIRPQIGNHSFHNFTDTYEAKDGVVVISVIGNKIWERFTRAIENNDLAEDERFDSDEKRYENRELIQGPVASWVSEKSVSEVIQILEKARVPCTKVNDVQSLLKNPQVEARETLVNLSYSDDVTVPAPGIPVKLTETPGCIKSVSPELGEHNNEIYGELLGFSKDKISELTSNGII